MQLDGKVALVTGAGSGIGKAVALLLAREGAKVAALDLSEDDAQQTAQEIERAGGSALALRPYAGGAPASAASLRGRPAHHHTGWHPRRARSLANRRQRLSCWWSRRARRASSGSS